MCVGCQTIRGPKEDRVATGGGRRGSLGYVESCTTLEPYKTWGSNGLGSLHGATETRVQSCKESG